MLRYALFDLDDTLYAAQTGLWSVLRARMDQFMVERLALPADSVSALRERYFQQYGTTLNGLRQEQYVNSDEYLAFVHDVPLERFLQPDPALDRMLARIPLAKVVFTNADTAHARRVLALLGVANHFDAIVDIQALSFHCKPDARAYAYVLSLLGAQATECVFIEDSARNLRPAHELGMLTVLVSPVAGPMLDTVDYHVSDVLAVEAIIAAHIASDAGHGLAHNAGLAARGEASL